ncbi:class I SAM-dependent methyltransferase [Solirubrobacter phytolaccae]|uniref:Class I SAM-dependent methyltransferase n=1 Tax=Solirubrobacter phytolaccae TaxID=1404360 RepID=A0A9X3ND14_9ACTN|nr:class I SAM-dependent methyltransferase [Solirubrobacter phytolaccae]MDA0184420.1 class I SAM-dependent methyltransferase [Solirubrobacter phytolaccae]
MTVLEPAAQALPADALYGRLLASAAQHLDGDGPAPRARIRAADGGLEVLPLDRWLAPADATDDAILQDLRAPVLDLGCGPGRHLARLRELGKDGLGVDLSTVAVAFARERGATAITGSLWDAVPGTYRTILLLDGNIGIGGAPILLLKRAAELLRDDGEIVVETDPPGMPTRRVRMRIEAPGMVSEWFRWARVGADDAAAIAERAGLHVTDRRELSGRTFVTLGRRP